MVLYKTLFDDIASSAPVKHQLTKEHDYRSTHKSSRWTLKCPHLTLTLKKVEVSFTYILYQIDNVTAKESTVLVILLRNLQY